MIVSTIFQFALFSVPAVSLLWKASRNSILILLCMILLLLLPFYTTLLTLRWFDFFWQLRVIVKEIKMTFISFRDLTRLLISLIWNILLQQSYVSFLLNLRLRSFSLPYLITLLWLIEWLRLYFLCLSIFLTVVFIVIFIFVVISCLFLSSTLLKSFVLGIRSVILFTVDIIVFLIASL